MHWCNKTDVIILNTFLLYSWMYVLKYNNSERLVTILKWKGCDKVRPWQRALNILLYPVATLFTAWPINVFRLHVSFRSTCKVVFWQMQKLKLSISKIKSCMLKKSTVFNFLYIFQLIQKVLTSNFLNLVLNIHICLYKNSKILFLLEKNNF